MSGQLVQLLSNEVTFFLGLNPFLRTYLRIVAVTFVASGSSQLLAVVYVGSHLTPFDCLEDASGWFDASLNFNSFSTMELLSNALGSVFFLSPDHRAVSEASMNSGF